MSEPQTEAGRAEAELVGMFALNAGDENLIRKRVLTIREDATKAERARLRELIEEIYDGSPRTALTLNRVMRLLRDEEAPHG